MLVSDVTGGFRARVSLGFRSTGGYGIHVVNVAVEDGHIRLTVVLTSPLPRQSQIQIVTYPFHLVAISKEDIVSPPGTTWSMATKDGNVLAETVYPAAPTLEPTDPPPTLTPDEGVGEVVPFFSIAKGAAGSPRLDVGRGPALEIVRNSGDLGAVIGYLLDWIFRRGGP